MSLNGWDIDVAGTRGVIAQARTEHRELGTEANVLRNALTDAAESVNSGLITGALMEIYEGYLGPLVASGVERADKVLTETANAVQAYIDGDQVMAQNANAQAAVAAPSIEPDTDK